MRIAGMVIFMAALILFLPVAGVAQIITETWYFNDGEGTDYRWGDADPELGQFWERMGKRYVPPEDTACAYGDILTPPQEYYAVSEIEAGVSYFGYFSAEIFLSNNYPGHENPVYAAIGYGTPGNAASFIQVGPAVSVNVTNMTIGCGEPYSFIFGGPYEIFLENQALMIKIWTTVPPGDVHIYWYGQCCPSALHYDSEVSVEEETWGTIKRMYNE